MKGTDLYWTPIRVAVPDDDRQVLLCKETKTGILSYSLGYYDGARFVTNGVAKVTHWIDYPDLRPHENELWVKLKKRNAIGFKWKEDDDEYLKIFTEGKEDTDD